MKSIWRALAVSSLLVLAAALSAAQTRSAGVTADLAPHPLAVRLAAAQEPLPLEELIDAALVFSGASEAQLPLSRQRLKELIGSFRKKSEGLADERALGEQALAFLHKDVLRRYSPLQARVDVALETGDYNCVSSAILYLLLARAVGLAVSGVRTADHAFCTVEVAGAPVDVETTNPYGFDPGTRREFTDSFGKVTGFAYVPPSNYSGRQAIDEKDLLALILYDRISFAAAQGDHQSAVAPAVTGWTLAPSSLNRTALIAALSNRAVQLGTAGRFQEALSFLGEAEEDFGEEPGLTKRRGELLHNWIVELVRKDDLDGAERLLADSRNAEALGAADRTSLAVSIVETRAEKPARMDDYQSAAGIIAGGLSRIGPDPELLQAYEVYSHNVFVQHYNARRFSEAKAAVEDALARFPASVLLRQDLQSATKALARE